MWIWRPTSITLGPVAQSSLPKRGNSPESLESGIKGIQQAASQGSSDCSRITWGHISLSSLCTDRTPRFSGSPLFYWHCPQDFQPNAIRATIMPCFIASPRRRQRLPSINLQRQEALPQVIKRQPRRRQGLGHPRKPHMGVPGRASPTLT